MAGYYKDLREFLDALDEGGLLYRVSAPVNKDTELMPLVRWEFRGLPAEERKAFLFDHVVDSHGRTYRGSVAVGVLGASRAVYAAGMKCKPSDIPARWHEALLNPIPPTLVASGPVKEEIHDADECAADGCGLEEFPVPISLPGFDPAPYFASPYWVSKDPETGIANVGTYRGMLKGPNRIGLMTHPTQHLGMHFGKCHELGKPLEAALVLGTAPAIGMCSVAKLPYGVAEYAVAGAIAREPIELVRCETVDLEVPATAEIVVEGEIRTDLLEAEGPFGEFTGYMGHRTTAYIFEVKCITHRRDPIFQSFISQFPPSESSLIKKLNQDYVYYKILKHDCNIPVVQEVAFHEMGGSGMYIVIRVKKTHQSQVWQALFAASALEPAYGKVIVAVDEDIDPHDPESVNWALSFRMQPYYDVRVLTGKMAQLDPSSAPPGASPDERRYPDRVGASCVLIDATRKFPFPPVSLPGKPFMEAAKKRWEELGLPALQPRVPWYGYELGLWDQENREEAEWAVQGKYRLTAERLARRTEKVE